MRRKTIWVWIVCLALLVCSLTAWLLFGGKKNETAQNHATQEAVSTPADGQKTSAAATVSPEQNLQAEQSTPGQTVNSEKQDNPSSVAEPAADVELPEIEILIADDNNRNNERDSGHESAAPEPSGTDKPSSTEKPQAETLESNEPKPTPEAHSEPSVSIPPQPEPEPGNSDIIIQDNGDILLPEVP